MSDTVSLMFGPWVPDFANVPVPVSSAVMEVPAADCSNVYFANGRYQSLPGSVAQGTALPGQCLGAITVIDQEGSPQIYAGTATKLYWWNGAGWTDVSNGFTFLAASWSFAQFGSDVLACFAPPQDSQIYDIWYGTVSTRYLTMPIGGTGFSIPNGVIAGSVVGVVNQFAVIGDVWVDVDYMPLGNGNGVQTVFTTTLTQTPIAPCYVYAGQISAGIGESGPLVACLDNGAGAFAVTGMTGTINYNTGLITLTFTTPPPTGSVVQATYLQSFPYRVQWSAIANDSSFPTPLTQAALAAQSSYEDLSADFGRVQAIIGFPQYGVVLQRSGITRMTYVGGDVVFSFAPYEKKHGAVSRLAIVVVGNVIYYVSDEGFYATDGNSAFSIGTTENGSVGVDQWFKDNVNPAAIQNISAGYDFNTRCVVFAIPTGSNMLPDTLVFYSPASTQWTKAAVPVELVFADYNSAGQHRLGMFNQAHTFATLSGPTMAGYVESADVFWPDGNTRYTFGIKPVIACTDTPTARAGVRSTMDEAIRYTPDVARDKFTKVCNVTAHGMNTRVRVSSTAFSTLTGAQLITDDGGPF